MLGGAFQDINLLDELGNGDAGEIAANSKDEKIILPSQLLNQQLSTLNAFGGIEGTSKPALTPTPTPPSVFSMFQVIRYLSQFQYTSIEHFIRTER